MVALLNRFRSKRARRHTDSKQLVVPQPSGKASKVAVDQLLQVARASMSGELFGTGYTTDPLKLNKVWQRNNLAKPPRPVRMQVFLTTPDGETPVVVLCKTSYPWDGGMRILGVIVEGDKALVGINVNILTTYRKKEVSFRL